MKTKEQKRQEAIDRQKTYDKLTKEQKLDKLNKGGYSAKKEKAKLNK